jgi:hypothetical protein
MLLFHSPPGIAMLVGVGRDQACVHGEPLTTDKTGCDAGTHDALEHAAEDIAVMEALVAGTRERRVIR